MSDRPMERLETVQQGVSVFMDSVRRHDSELRMLAYHLLPDGAAMDETLRDAYLEAFRGYSGLQKEAWGRTWLYRVVYNACLHRPRSAGGRTEAPVDRTAEPAGSDDTPDLCEGGCALAYRGLRSRDLAAMDQADHVVEHVDLATAFTSLPEDRRAAVLLVDAAGFSYDETAHVLGVRPGTMASRLHHARSVLTAARVEGETAKRSGEDGEDGGATVADRSGTDRSGADGLLPIATWRDQDLGDRLRRLKVPEHGPGFFADLEKRLEAGELGAGDQTGRARRGSWLRRALTRPRRE